MKITHKVSQNLSQQLMQGYDLQMVQNVSLFPGALFAEFVEEYCRETPALRLKGYQDRSYDINYSLIAKEDSLFDHLSFQIETSFMLEEKEEALAIASSLDRNGFYAGEETSVARKMWRLSPLGIATRSAREAMMVQLEESSCKNTIAYQVLKDHYQLFLKNSLSALCKKLPYSSEEIEEAIDIIKTLTPFPGRAFAAGHVQYIKPEMKITFDGKWKMEFIKEFYPTCEIIKGAEGLNRAKKFIYQLHQRKNRLEWIVSRIIKKQHHFLLGQGEKELLYRSDLLEEMSISESMLSRILSEKYIETPSGIFPLAYFFSRKKGGPCVDTSVEKAKNLLQKLIDQENKQNPHPDQVLSDLLKEQGVLCSRRSVAKYRKALNIPAVYHRSV
ncbi:MAG: RNA polymerase sigma-54 factor [Chlamydiia bacterium]|nr:RNA polymerase sigma-54 factor [Chlamydiia bacterium]MCH9618290.1 RNA polymerase sigma-54 factor [Chlamydiia bacterium]MCH9624163.1 RNA polymerase sigma-54 factor [Chlamydiia bacterium]